MSYGGGDIEHRSPGQGHVFIGMAEPSPDAATPERVGDLYRLSDPELSELPLEPLLNELLERIRQVLAVDTAAFLLLDDDQQLLVARAAKGIEEEVEKGVRIPLGKGFAGRIASERVPIFIADVNHADILNPILREKGISSLLGVPMVVQGKLIGVLHVGSLVPREFTNDDASLLQLAALRAGSAIERTRLFEALAHEHGVAMTLQRSLLPEHLPDTIGVSVAARYLPARDDVGGDWYDVLELDRGRVGIAIGDVVGHGVRAAALMGQLRTALRAYAIEEHSPRTVLEQVDRLLQTIRMRGMATAVYGVFDPETSELTIASAGHPPPIVVPGEGEPYFLSIQSGPPLGTLAYPNLSETTVTVAFDETIMLYTDGLVEVRGESLDRGLERLAEAARGHAPPEALCSRVSRALVSPEGSADDIAMVALQNTTVSRELTMHFPADPTVLAHIRRVLRRWVSQFGAGRDDIGAITLACGEACANAIEHAYSPGPASFELRARADADVVTLAVHDAGRWRAPRGQHRGRGLRIIKASMDHVEVTPGENGTVVVMRRRLRG